MQAEDADGQRGGAESDAGTGERVHHTLCGAAPEKALAEATTLV